MRDWPNSLIWVVSAYRLQEWATSDYASVTEEYALSVSIYVEAIRWIRQAEVVGCVYFTEMGST